MRVEHIALYVNDLEGAKEFFEKYFSAKSGVLYSNPKKGFKSYFLSFDDGSRLELMNSDSVCKTGKAFGHLGYAHIAFSVGSKEKVDLLTERLSFDGYEIVSRPRVTGDGYYESCIEAFEGNMIEITV